MACLPREGKLACQGKRVLGACREREGGFITGVPVRKERKTECLSRKEGIKVGVPAREWRLGMALLPREGKLACKGRRVFGACRERKGGD